MDATTQHDNRTVAGTVAKPQRFLLFWFVLNLLQIAFTELTSDEGYYWFYAQRLQWGYYDHPPVVALLIKAGSFLFGGELGVRFFNVVLSTAGLHLFFLLLPESLKQSRKTFWVLLSAPLLHYLAFLVFPDGPLLFFSLLFLVGYKRFLAKPNALTSLWLGLALALMAYSKYHGALVLLFVVMANPKLLKSGYFYLSLAAAALLFAPHLWWQYNEGFPTLKYHLSGRTGTWSLRHVGEYLSQQIVAIGPGLIFLPFVIKAKDVFERTLLFVIVGTFGFFLVSSFKTFVHFHWTSIALYPLLYFAVRYYNEPRRRKLFTYLVVPFAVLFLAARLLLMLPFFPNLHAGEDYYSGRKQWAKDVANVAAGRPVFIPDNLREASLYSFYSGQRGVTLYTHPGKKSQYELWGYEDSLQGREVLLLTKYPHGGSAKLSTLGWGFYWSVVPRFQSYYNNVSLKASFLQTTKDSAVFSLTFTNSTSRPVSFANEAGKGGASLVYSINKNKNGVKSGDLFPLTTADGLAPGAALRKRVSLFISDLFGGEYEVVFGIRSGVLPEAWVASTELKARR